ncbi:MAG: hypothetical protein IJC88_01665 [Oscillospiraceae bacterium]|nr:hypothetical protein [Oscillospiraceae bacterium]
MSRITVDFTKTVGKIKPMHAVNNGPIKARGDQSRENFTLYSEAGIPYARNHDAAFMAAYGGEHTVDIWAIFPNPNADVNDSASYDFILTDEYLKTIQEAGTKVFYRLGNKIEHWVKKYGTLPPPDFKTWAEICEHIIRHYTEGWADGFRWDIEYWEIWNEPDLDEDDCPNKRTWGGTKAQFFDLYEITAKHLKSCFPHLKIGGPALAWREDWAADFLREMHRREVPIDFFSWHIYCVEPKELLTRQNNIKKLLLENGYENAETNCNEWNYVCSWDVEYLRAVETIISMKGAAFTAACMLASQHSTLDMLMYYDARPGVWCGIFDSYTLRPFKGYYPFRMFNTLYRLGNEVECVSDDETVYAVAAKNGEDRAVMVCYYTDDDTAGEKTVDFVLGGEYRVELLDEENTCTELPWDGNTITMKRNSVLLFTSK